MQSNEAREVMVARVNDAYAKWSSFDAMPTFFEGADRFVPYKGPDEMTAIIDPSAARVAYVKALYAAAYQGEILGRRDSDIAVRKLAMGEVPKTGTVLSAG
jgi:hypothetical protein